MSNDGAGPTDNFEEDAQTVFRQPMAVEISGLTYGTLRDLRICLPEETSNVFAHLLNRGSSLE